MIGSLLVIEDVEQRIHIELRVDAWILKDNWRSLRIVTWSIERILRNVILWLLGIDRFRNINETILQTLMKRIQIVQDLILILILFSFPENVEVFKAIGVIDP